VIVSDERPEVSVIVPVFNEADNLAELVDRVHAAMTGCARSFELLVVDDGSRDGTPQMLARLSGPGRPWLVALFLSRNYGQSTALQAGFDHARGRYLVTLDGDLQNDPDDIPLLLRRLDEDTDVDCVSGWRVDRKDGALLRRWPSQIANRLISSVTRVRLHDYGCALKAYRRAVIDDLHLYGEQHRFIPALAAEVGARVAEVPVRHHPRTSGASKYGIDRTLRVLLDLVWIRFSMRFSTRPIHAFGGAGALTALAGLAILLWLTFEKLVLGEQIGGRPLLMLGVMLVLLGANFLATGLLGEMLVRIRHEPEGRRQYLLRPPPRDVR